MEATRNKSDAVVSGALAFVLRVSRLAGIAPLGFVKHRGGWRVSVSPGFGLYGIILVCSTNILTLTCVLYDYGLEPSQSVRMSTTTRRAVWIMDASFLMVMSILGAVTAPKQMKSLIGCLNILQKINNELKTNQWPKPSERKKCIMFVTWSLITVVITIVDQVFITLSASEDNGNLMLCFLYSSYYVCYWILQLLVMQFMMITTHILQSFRAVNAKLRVLSQVAAVADPKILESVEFTRDKYVFTVERNRKKSVNTVIDSLAFVRKFNSDTQKLKKPIHESVRCLAHTFVSLCAVVREVDIRNGLQLIMLLGSFLLHLIITPYYLFNNLFSKSIDSKRQTINILLQILWCFFHTINLMMLIEPCHLTVEEIEITRELISQLMRYSSSIEDPLAIELDLFYKHLVLNKVSYSPMNVTTLTRSLVATIIGSITTYLVVIIQL